MNAPSLYWNWAQAAAVSGRKGEALWALLRAQELTPRDRDVTREMERRLLEDAGFDVVTAADGTQAIDRLGRQLGTTLEVGETAHTFAEIGTALRS